MDVQCPKCRFKFNYPDVGAQGVVTCICPRCGNPFEQTLSSQTAQPVGAEPVAPVVPPVSMAQPAPAPAPTQTIVYAKAKSSNTMTYALIAAVAVIVVLAACVGYMMANHSATGLADSQPQPAEQVASSMSASATSSASSSVPVDVSEVYMDLGGSIGGDNTSALVMTGQTGWYVPYEGAPKRTLRLDSYDPATKRCVLTAYLRNKQIGYFDGTFDSFSSTDESGEEHYGQTYEGVFTNINNGIQLKFYLYVD